MTKECQVYVVIIQHIIYHCIFMLVVILLMLFLIGMICCFFTEFQDFFLLNLYSIYHYYQDLSRRDGYLDFYRQTRNLRRTPLIIISTSNAILVIVIKLLEDYSDKLGSLQPWHCLAILTTIEVIICLTALIWYLSKNKKTKYF